MLAFKSSPPCVASILICLTVSTKVDKAFQDWYCTILVTFEILMSRSIYKLTQMLFGQSLFWYNWRKTKQAWLIFLIKWISVVTSHDMNPKTLSFWIASNNVFFNHQSPKCVQSEFKVRRFFLHWQFHMTVKWPYSNQGGKLNLEIC